MIDLPVPAVERAAAAAGEARRGRGRHLAGVLAVTLPAVLLAIMGYRFRWLADDGDIALRTVRQILAGNGPVFNVGERVEVSTSALWPWLLAAVAFVTRLDVYTVVQVVSLVLGPAGLLLATAGTRRLYRHRAWVFPAGAAVVAVLPPFWEFTTSGLESPLIFFWLGLGWWLLARVGPGSGGRLLYGTAFTWGLGWLVRPDMAIATVFFLAALWLTARPARRHALPAAAAAFALPVAYQVFRMGYYAQIVPNTAVAKSAGSVVLGRGWAYLLNFAGPYLLWVPALLLAALAVLTRWPAARRPDPRAVAALAAGMLLAGYVVGIGGDFMHARMLLPPAFLLLLPVMVVPVPVPRRASLTRPVCVAVACACLTAWAVTCAASLRPPALGPGNPTGVSDERSFWIRWTGDPNPTVPGPFWQRVLGPPADPTPFGAAVRAALRSGRPGFVFAVPVPHRRTLMETAPLRYDVPVTIAVNGATLGLLGAAIPLNGVIVDSMALASPLGSHFEPSRTARAGHQKSLPLPWQVAEYTPAGYRARGVDAAQVAAARAALGCGELAGLQAAVRAPLTWGRFFDNLLHAYSYTRMVIPADPVAAEQEYC